MSEPGETRVLGLGGLFFRARDPEALGRWYARHLGIPSHGPWPQSEGFAVFAPFRADTAYWPEGREFMLNLRVRDLAGLLARLEAEGIAAETRAEWDGQGIGRFARIVDPEGNPIELWEPPE
jgi:predicted enzyme related to lactoylglutathione lyase